MSANPPISNVGSGVRGSTGVTVSVLPATDSGREWNEYVQNHPHSTVDHLWQWQRVFTEVFGQRCHYLAASREGRVVGVLPLVLFRSQLFGRFAVSVPYLNYGGILADDPEVASALVDGGRTAAKEFGASHVELRHRERVAPDLPFRQHKIGLTLALPGSTDALWQQIDRKVRNQVRKAQKEQLSSAMGGRELLGDFYSVFSRNMRDLGTPVYARHLFDATLREFPEQASVFVVRRADQPIAASIALHFRDVVLVPWASSLREFRQLCPNMLLYWNMLERAVALGAGTFDFGRSSPGGGTHQFKRQWDATETPLHWEYVMLSGGEPPNQGPTNPKFALAIETWKRLPLWIANACGPHLAKNLP